MKMRSMRIQWAGCAAALLLVAGLASAQAASAPGGSTSDAFTSELTGIAHLALRVSDMDAEVQFFGKLGFEEAFANAPNGKTLSIFIKVNDHEFIELEPQAVGASAAAQPLGFMYVCFETPGVRALHASYAAAKLAVTPVGKTFDGNLAFTVKDPAGRPTELLQYEPDSMEAGDKGQHVGDRRVSDELMGFELPTANMAAMQSFYQALGFDAEDDGGTVRLTIPANPDVRIVLRPAGADGVGQPEFLFPVDNAHRIADELHSTGLKVVRDKKLDFVHDPDGNLFVLLETGEHSPRHLLPWKK